MTIRSLAALAALAGTAFSITACSLNVTVDEQRAQNAPTEQTAPVESQSQPTESEPTLFAVIDGEEVPAPNIPMGDADTIERIIQEGMNNSHVMSILSTLTEEYGPRLTGSTRLQTAQRWARDQFSSWGMSNAQLHEWGTIATRFDRGPSTGKVFLVNSDPDKENKKLRDLEFSTLAWSRGTDGPTSGKVMHLPETLAEYEANAGEYADAWVLIKPSYTGRGGVRSTGYLMRQRMDDRHNIRKDIETKAVAASENTDANAADSNAWNGFFDYHGTPVPAVLTIDESTNPPSGTMTIEGFSEGPISEFTRDGDSVKFHWKHAMGASNIELTFDGDTAKGVSNSSSGNSFDLTFSKGAAPTEEAEADTPETVMAMVLKENPNGFISSSKDERVWTTSSNNWIERELSDYPEDIEINVRQSDYDYIAARANEGVDIVVEFDLDHTLTAGPVPVYNVIAEIQGTEFPDEVIVVSGHIDSWDGPGSMGTSDNGTGSAVTIEAARILASLGVQPKRTIRFCLWGGEEQGLLGSKGYINSLSDEEKAKISAAFVDDGGTNYQGGIPAADFMVDYLAAATAPINGRFYSETDGKFLNVNIRPTGEKINTHGGSDHASFNREGVPGFFWDEVGRADYSYTWHTQNDTFDAAIEEYLVQSATNTAVVAYNLANAPGLLPRASETEPTEAVEVEVNATAN
jgi:hypothetical protein